VVGAAKSGTTSLFHILRSDPKCFIPSLKEGRFFSQMPRNFKGGEAANFMNQGPRDIRDYLALYRGREESIKGDISNDYLYYYRKSISTIKSTYDSLGQSYPKIIIVLREPTARVISMYHHILRLGSDNEPLWTAFELSENREADGFAWMFNLKKVGASAEGVKAYKEAFQDVEVYLFEELFAGDRLKDLAQFIGLDAELVTCSEIRANADTHVQPRSILLHSLMIRITRILGFLRRVKWVKKLLKAFFVALIRMNKKPVAKTNNSDREAIKSYFHNDVLELERLLGKDLTAWK